MKDLQCCPFCGSTGNALVGQYGMDYRQEKGCAFIYCKCCHAQGPIAYGEQEAKDIWNKDRFFDE